jgi:hypothetical protein
MPIKFDAINPEGTVTEIAFALIDFENLNDALSPEYADRGFVHEMTLTDLLYIVAVEVLEKQNMHVYVTRYPVDNYQNIYPSKIKIKTTSRTRDIYQAVYAPSIP